MKKLVALLLLVAMVALLACGCSANDTQEEPPAADVETSLEGETSAEDAEAGAAYGDYMASIEEESLAMKDFLENEAMTQLDMNEKSQELYNLWDGALNYLWGELQVQLSEEEYDALLSEQLAWIEAKEKAVEEAGAEVEGGSMYPLVVNSEGARITEERVYELYELLK